MRSGRLVPEPQSEVLDLWDVKLQLVRCPSCGALWSVKQTCAGHQEWLGDATRVQDLAAFDALVAEEGSAKTERLAELRKLYERMGREWKW